MSDTKKEIVKGSDITGITSYYENAMVFHSNDKEKKHFFISYENLEKVVKLVNFELEEKRTRIWGTPIMDPQFDFIEFREFLLYNDECTTEEMELILRLISNYYERKRAGDIFIENENM